MIRCSECGASQQEGALFCSECGNFLLEASDGGQTAVLPFSQFSHPISPPFLQEEDLELDPHQRQVTIFIPISRSRIVLNLAPEIRIGRADAQSDMIPELDLTPHHGAETGVSRLHAVIRAYKQGITLTDLGSTNGTMLNMYRLAPEKPYFLRSGDEIRFGDLLIHLFFE